MPTLKKLRQLAEPDKLKERIAQELRRLRRAAKAAPGKLRKVKRSTVVIHVIAWGVAVLWILPFMGIVMASIRPFPEILHGWWDFSKFTPSLDNFFKAWAHPTAPLAQGMLNSLFVAVFATIIPMLIASLAGYGFARFRFPIKDYFFLTIVVLMAVPQQMVAVPIFQLMFDLRLVDNYLGLIIVHSAWGLAWIILFMRNFFTTFPIAIEEAAKVDGASDFQIFYKIALPMALPALASVAVLQFMWVWNDFFLALILIYSPDRLLATQRIPLMREVYNVDWGVLSAASLMVTFVPVLLYVLLQKYYIRGMIGWTVKG